jgi:hypothetical protein
MGAQFLLARNDEAMLLDAARQETKALHGIFE